MTTAHALLRGLHIAAGTAGLLSGAVSMSVRKGSPLHQRAGTVFFGSMLLMSASGATIAAAIRPNAGNMMGGFLTFYLVLTAWLAAWRAPGTTGALDGVAAALGFAIALVGGAWVLEAANAPNGRLHGFPPALFAIFGAIAFVASAFDVRMIRRGGVRGVPRLTRHLWRMCFAMFMATSSFFLGAASRRFPAAVRDSSLRVLPVLLVLAALAWWLVRYWLIPTVRGTRPRILTDGGA
jgi:hypothetical protein